MKDKEERHRQFCQELLESDKAVRFFADYCRSWGHRVKVPELRVTPSWEKRHEYADETDLWVEKGRGVWLKIDVKQTRQRFTCCEDYLYPMLMVCPAHRGDPEHIPDAIVQLSRDRKYQATVKKDTRPHWTLHRWYDKRDERWRKSWRVPKEMADWRPVRFGDQEVKP